MRTYALLAASALSLLNLVGCGFRADDPELEEAIAWGRQFKEEQPELMVELADECQAERGNAGFSRDVILQAVNCVRGKYEARGGVA